MKTVDLPPTGGDLNALLRQAREENLILRTPEGREYVLAELDDFDREIEMVRENGPLMHLLAERSRAAGRHTAAEVREKFGL